MSTKNTKSKEERSMRQTLMTEVEPLLDSIAKRQQASGEECEFAFKNVGFGNPHKYMWDDPSIAARTALNAYEILPHQYVWSKLLLIDELIYCVQQSIESGSFKEIMDSLHDLQEVTSAVFTEVNEFLNGPLAKMTRREWEEQPSWKDWNNAYNELNWTIGGVSMSDSFGFGSLSLEETLEDLENAIHN